MSALLELEAEGVTSDKTIKELKLKLDSECRSRIEIEEKNKILEEKVNNLQKQLDEEVKARKLLEMQIGELSVNKTLTALSSVGDPKAFERIEQLIIEDTKSRKGLEIKLEEITKSQKATAELYETINKEKQERKNLEAKLEEATKHSKVIESQLQEEIKTRKNFEVHINTVLKPAAVVKGSASGNPPVVAIQKNKIFTPAEALELLETINLPKEPLKKKVDIKHT